MKLSKQHATAEDHAPSATHATARSSEAHEALAAQLQNSPRQVAQAQRTAALFGPAVMQQAEAEPDQMLSDEPLQAMQAEPRASQPAASQAAVVQRVNHPDAELAFAAFVAAKREAGIAYGPVGDSNCEALALQLVAAFNAAGLAGSATETRIGKGRYAVASPNFIDAAWNGGVVTNGGAPVANFVHFENHTAVKYGDLIYDPTCGYVGAEAGWVCAFEYIEEIGDFEFPIEEDAEDAPSYWKAEGPVAMAKPYAKLQADGTLALMTEAEVRADVAPQPDAQEEAAAQAQ